MTFLGIYKLNFKMNIEEKVTKGYLKLVASLFQKSIIVQYYEDIFKD